MNIKPLLRRAAAITLLLLFPILTINGCKHQEDPVLSVLIPIQGSRFDELAALFSKTHPEVTFNRSAYYGSTASPYLYRRFQMNDLTDIIITTYAPPDELQKSTLLDLSGYDFIQDYKESVLTNMNIDGKIYLLEGPSSARGIAYNKTLFAEKGWKVPSSHEEFIALIKQIRAEEKEMMPIAIPGKYSGTYFTLMSELSHCDYLQTPAGAAWQRDFADGTASSREGFQTGLALLQDWLDAGAFDPRQSDASDGDDYELLASRGSAMSYVMGKQSDLVELTEASEDDFGMFPLYGKGADSEFCATTYGVKFGLNKKLGEPGNEKKLKAAVELLELLSTEEGQMIFHTGLGDILPLVGSSPSLPSLFEDINEVLNQGHAAPFLYAGYEDVLAPAGEYIKDVCLNGGELTGVYDVMDSLRRETLDNVEDTYIATVTETLDERQTAQFVANALHAQGLGDFALVSLGDYSPGVVVAGGSNGKLYAGGIDLSNVDTPLSSDLLKHIVTLTLNGAQVRDLLEQGRVLENDAGNTHAYEYFSAGLAVERDKNGHIKSALLNGSPLEDETVYTVAFPPLDFSDAAGAAGSPQETDVVWKDAYRAYVAELGTITPDNAGQ